MYLLVDTPKHGTGDTIQSVLEDILTVTIIKKETDNPGWSVTYKLKYCYEKKSSISYGENYTEDEVRKDFYRTQGLAIAKANGFVLFKEVL